MKIGKSPKKVRAQAPGGQLQQTPRIAPKAQAAAKAVAKAPAAKVRPQAPGRQSQQTPRMAPKAPSAAKATPVAPSAAKLSDPRNPAPGPRVYPGAVVPDHTDDLPPPQVSQFRLFKVS